MKICRETPNLAKIGQKYRKIDMKTEVSLIVAGGIQAPQQRSLPTKWYYYESNQQDAIIQINLLFLVGSTCFGRCFRPSSGALYYIYSFW
jgi:hypothetical protein